MTFKKNKKYWGHPNFWLSRLKNYALEIIDGENGRVKVIFMSRFKGGKSFQVLQEFDCANQQIATEQLGRLFVLFKGIKDEPAYGRLQQGMYPVRKVKNLLNSFNECDENGRVIIDY